MLSAPTVQLADILMNQACMDARDVQLVNMLPTHQPKFAQIARLADVLVLQQLHAQCA